MNRRRLFFAAAALVALPLLLLGASQAATSGSVTVPSSIGQTASDNWTGTIQPGTNPTSDCTPPSPSPVDEHDGPATVPAGAYPSHTASFRILMICSL